MKTQLDIVTDAITIVRPSIDLLFKRTVRQELHIVVMNPRMKPWDGTLEPSGLC